MRPETAGMDAMKLALPDLPYGYDALEPYISRRTLEFHHGRHHRAYVDKTRDLAKEVHLGGLPLERIIQVASRQAHHRDLLVQASQAWNHAFFWRCLRPGGGGAPEGPLAGMIDAAFGDYAGFLETFTQAAVSLVGSGWVWLVVDDMGVTVTRTPNGETPIAHGMVPLLTVDVWEHAYYLDYQNRRADYVAAVMSHLVNWEFAVQNLKLKRPRPKKAPVARAGRLAAAEA